MTKLIRAANVGDLAQVQALLAQRADVNIVDEVNNYFSYCRVL